MDTTFVDGTVVEPDWLNDVNDLVYGFPSQSGNAGKVLGTNGTVLSWTTGGGSGSNSFGISVFDYIPANLHADIQDGTSVTDVTSYIQTAINTASHALTRVIYFPAGNYVVTTLYMFYDVTLNPGYNVDRNTSLSLIGEGVSPDYLGWGGFGGTTLISAATTGNILIVLPNSLDTGSRFGRDAYIEGFNFVGNTSNYLVVAEGIPSLQMKNCRFMQNNLAGSCLALATNYSSSIEDCLFTNIPVVNNVGVSTGYAINFSSNVQAGLLCFRDVSTGNFSIGLRISGITAEGTTGAGANWQNITAYNCQFSGSSYGVWVNTPSIAMVDQLSFIDCYWEGICTSFIADSTVSGGGGIANLKIHGSWCYGAGLTGPAIDLSAPKSYSIQNVHIQDCYNAFLNTLDIPSGGLGTYVADHITFTFPGGSGYPPSPVTLFTGKLPFLGVEYPVGGTNISLCDAIATTQPMTYRTNYPNGTSSSFQAGHVFSTHTKNYGVTSGTKALQSDGFPGVVHIRTNGATVIQLPSIAAGLPHGHTTYIKNIPSGTNTITVTTDPSDGGATVGTIAIGDDMTFTFYRDGTTTGWL